MLLFLSEKKSKPVGYIQEQCIGKLGKIQNEVFIIDF